MKRLFLQMIERLKSVITHTQQVDEDILDLLSHTTIGTNGAKYTHLHTAQKIHSLHQPHFFTMRRHQKAIGNVTICERPMWVGAKLVDSFYIRYFAFQHLFQSTGVKTKKNRQSIFDDYLNALFSSSNLNPFEPQHQASMFWAFIDPENNRSWNMAERYGFETIGHFKTFGFSRFSPKKHPQVSGIHADEIKETWNKTKAFYSEHSNLSDVHLFESDGYFVYRENGKIVAGVQTFDIHWRVNALPGWQGKLIVKTLPFIPLVRRVFNPKSFQFLAIEGLFWEPGHANKVDLLLESVLAIRNKHSILAWVDVKDDQLNKKWQQMRLGILQKMKSDNAIEILAKFNGQSKEFMTEVRNRVKYISAFDAT